MNYEPQTKPHVKPTTEDSFKTHGSKSPPSGVFIRGGYGQ